MYSLPLLFLLVATIIATKEVYGWQSRIKVQLRNDQDDFSLASCTNETLAHLQAEMYIWIKDELLSIFGEDNVHLGDLVSSSTLGMFTDVAEYESDFHCKRCNEKQCSSSNLMHNVAYLLHWTVQLALDDWIKENKDVMRGCMDGNTSIQLLIEKDAETVFSADQAKFSDHTRETLSLLQRN